MCWGRSRRPSGWPGATGPTRRMPASPPSSTTAPRSWIWSSSWPCARRYDIRLDELEQNALKLLHAKTGAAVARDIFGVKDAVYEAIRWHTTGKPDMTLLEKVIYLADYIEPNRDFPGVDELRRAVYDDLDKGLLMGLSDTIDEMERMGNPVHHDTLEARDFLLRGEAK